MFKKWKLLDHDNHDKQAFYQWILSIHSNWPWTIPFLLQSGLEKMFNFRDAKFKETKFPTTNEFYVQSGKISLQFPRFPAMRLPNSTFFFSFCACKMVSNIVTDMVDNDSISIYSTAGSDCI